MQIIKFLILFFLFIILTASPQGSNFSNLPFPHLSWILLAVALSGLFAFIARKKPIANSSFVTLVFLAGLLLRIIYLSDTPYNIRSYDSDGHLDYIKYVATHRSLPPPGTGWEFWQPPAYYSITGFIYKLASVQASNLILLQLLSLAFCAGFLYFGIKTLRLFLPESIGDKYFHLSSLLLVFWPAGIIYSTTITNDSLLYFLTAGGIFFVVKWFLDGKLKNILLSILFLLASMLTKSNGIVLLGIICFAVLLRSILAAKNSPKKIIYFLKIFLFLALVSLASFSIMFFSRSAGNETDRSHGFFTNMPYVNSGLMVGRSIKNFVIFDAKDFFQNTFTDPWNDKGGRQHFMNYLLKTSLFGEFNYPQKILTNQAMVLNYLLILIIIIVCVKIIADLVNPFKLLKEKDAPLPYVLATPAVILFLVTLICYRYLYPYSCNGDFRYIYPAIIFISAIFARAIYSLDMKIHSRFTAYGAYFFICASIIFFISLAIIQ